MNMSHKLTFSLASIFLLLAFAVVPAMAHAPGANVAPHAHPSAVGSAGYTNDLNGDGTADDPGNAVDLNDDNDTEDDGERIALHNPHPRVLSITLKPGATVRGTTAKVVADDAATTGVVESAFTLVVDFDRDIADDATTTAVPDFTTGTPTADAQLLAAALSSSLLLVDNAASPGTPTIVINRVANDDSKYELVVTIPDTNVPDADTAATATNDDTLKFRILIVANNAYSLQTAVIRSDSVNAVTIPGAGNLASSVYEFTLAKELPAVTPAPDTTRPTLTIRHAPDDEAALPTSGNVTFTFTFSEDLGSNDAGFSLGDVTIENGSAVDFGGSGMVYTLEVRPTDPMMDVKVTVAANAVADGAGNKLAADKSETYMADDTENPTVVITSAPGTGDNAGKIVVTFTFSEPLTDGSFTSEDIDRTQSNVLLAGEPMKSATDAKVYTLVVTPPATGSAMLTLKTGSVEDEQGNKLQGDQSHTYTPPIPPGPATITTPAGGNVGNTTAGATITITFNKDPGTVTAMMGTTSVAVGGTSGTTRTITAAATADTYSISLTWTGTDAGTSDDGRGTLTYTIPVQGVVSSANMLSNLSIPGKSFVLLTHETSMGLPNLPDNATAVVWNDMPDIESLFFSGGSINITVAGVGARSVLFTEFMWARNLAKIGTDEELAHQWIEIYNNNNDAVTATVRTKSGRPALPHATDRVSNVVGEGWKLENLGQNGSDDGEAGSAEMDFVSMYKIHKSAGDKDGSNKGHWGVSSNVYLALHKGTPGAFERSAVGTISATKFTVGGVIFNEIANRSNTDKAYEWIELRNKTGGNINLKNWQISIVTAVGQDNAFITFPNADRVIGANSVLLLVASDPELDQSHPLQTGWDITQGANAQAKGVGAHSPRYMVVSFAGNGLPDDGNFVLILRNHNNKRGQAAHLIDIAGYDTDLKVSAEESGYTNLWPLKGGVRDAQLSNNKLEVNQVHRRQKDNIWGTSSTNYGRNGGNHHDDAAWRNVGWTAIGYKRNAVPSGMLGGTPGYQNNTLVNRGGTAINNVIISEIMYDTSRNTPQWIELQNMSDTHGIDVNQWSIFVDNYHLMDADTDYTLAPLTNKEYKIDGFIPPNQTMLIVSHAARHHTMLPTARIFNLRMARGARLLNPYGFEIRLKSRTNEGAGNQDTIDVVGNLGDAPEGSRRSDAKSYADLRWMLPAGVNSDGVRVSLSRRTAGQVLNSANGRNAGDWILSDQDSRMDTMFTPTYYGLSNDISSPGQTRGSVLPVQLSLFRPTLEDGKVTIRWATESELDNAGFNILRSETRDGEFTQVNEQMIQGKGTTAERSTYKWVDTTAKPGAVYYYQIEDVSFAGEHTKLATTKLKGLISAKGKLTTQWGDLKNLR